MDFLSVKPVSDMIDEQGRIAIERSDVALAADRDPTMLFVNKKSFSLNALTSTI